MGCTKISQFHSSTKNGDNDKCSLNKVAYEINLLNEKTALNSFKAEILQETNLHNSIFACTWSDWGSCFLLFSAILNHAQFTTEMSYTVYYKY